MIGLVLYGPPASGKTTITEHLERLDPKYRLFRRVKIGAGRTDGYRVRPKRELEQLRAQGDVIWENSRYGATYAIDRAELDRLLAAGLIPVIHAGQPGVVAAVRSSFPAVRWLSVDIRCTLESATLRLRARGHAEDLAERLDAWRDTVVLAGADIAIDTTTASPDVVAAQIHSFVRSQPASGEAL